jgi:hypothetical protein
VIRKLTNQSSFGAIVRWKCGLVVEPLNFWKKTHTGLAWLVSGFRRGLNEVFALLECYFNVMHCIPEEENLLRGFIFLWGYVTYYVTFQPLQP